MNNKYDYNIIIENGLIVDGMNREPYEADIGIVGKNIEKIGDLGAATGEVRINASNLIVSPGFIDVHTHTDKHSAFFPKAEGKIMQGITTDVCGLCGTSFAPLGNGWLEEYIVRNSDLLVKAFDNPFREITYQEFLEETNLRGNSTNIAMFVGNSNLRINVAGYEERKVSANELGIMKSMMFRAMKEGAFGLSTGLTYVPSMFSSIEELIELCKVIAPYKGIYNSHMRNEGNEVIKSIEEVIRIARESGCHGHISHLKVMGKKNHGKSSECLRLIEEANKEGVDITFDVYPYTAGSTSLSTLLPRWVLSEGFGEDFSILWDKRDRIIEDIYKEDWDSIIVNCGYENIFIGSAEGNPNYEGKSITQIAKELSISEIDTVFKVLIDSNGQATMIYHAISEEDLKTFIKSPYCMIGTDAYTRHYEGPTAEGKPHPRNYGGFPRYIRKYLIDDSLLSMQEGIYRITGLAAKTFGLANRGELKEGYVADITVFNPNSIRDIGDYNMPNQKPEGIEWVLVNGQIAVMNGEFNNISAGEMLKFRIG